MPPLNSHAGGLTDGHTPRVIIAHYAGALHCHRAAKINKRQQLRQDTIQCEIFVMRLKADDDDDDDMSRFIFRVFLSILLNCVKVRDCHTFNKRLLTHPLSGRLLLVSCGTDGPHVVCDSVDGVELGQRNVCLRCDVTARPRPTSVHWQLDHVDNRTDVIADHSHWAVVQVGRSVD